MGRGRVCVGGLVLPVIGNMFSHYQHCTSTKYVNNDILLRYVHVGVFINLRLLPSMILLGVVIYICEMFEILYHSNFAIFIIKLN